HPCVERGRYDVVPAIAKLAHKFRPDSPAPTDDYESHMILSWCIACCSYIRPTCRRRDSTRTKDIRAVPGPRQSSLLMGWSQMLCRLHAPGRLMAYVLGHARLS